MSSSPSSSDASETQNPVSHWTPSFLSVKFFWGNTKLHSKPIRRNDSYAKCQEIAFNVIQEHRKDLKEDIEELPKTKEEIYFTIGGTRVENVSCMSAHITEILGTDVGKEGINVRIHNTKSNFLSRTRSFKTKLLASPSERQCDVLLESIYSKVVKYETEKKEKIELTFKQGAAVAFFNIEKNVQVGGVAVMIGILDIQEDDLAKVTISNVVIPNDELLQLCSRRPKGGWVPEKEVECKNGVINFEINESGTYMVRRYKMRIGLKIDIGKLDEKYDMVYPDKDDKVYSRGGMPYKLPCGFKRIAIKVPNFKEVENWCVAYHGTNVQAVHSILRDGLLRPLTTPSGFRDSMLAPPRNHIALDKKVFDIENFADAVFVSPNINYSSSGPYAPEFGYNGKKYKIVLQVRVKPKSFTQHKSTTGEEFNGELVEWRVENPEDIVVYGILYKEV